MLRWVPGVRSAPGSGCGLAAGYPGVGAGLVSAVAGAGAGLALCGGFRGCAGVGCGAFVERRASCGVVFWWFGVFGQCWRYRGWGWVVVLAFAGRYFWGSELLLLG